MINERNKLRIQNSSEERSVEDGGRMSGSRFEKKERKEQIEMFKEQVRVMD